VATHLVREGANVVAVQELLGHARLDTTQRYVEVDRADLHRAVAALEGDR
jgi:site-specific recombinase XerD